MATIKANMNRPNKKNKQIYKPKDLIDFCVKNEIKTIPLDLEKLTEQLNIAVKKCSDVEYNGCLKKENSGWVIILNNQLHTKYNRVVWAFLLAKYFLMGFRDNYFEVTTLFRGKNFEEPYLCFACNILIPYEEMKNQIKKGNNDILKLSDFFNVHSLAIRVQAMWYGFKGHGF